MQRKHFLLAALAAVGLGLVGSVGAQEPSRYDKLKLAPADPQALRVVLRTGPYLPISPSGAGSGGSRVQPRPFADGLVALPALDASLVIRVLDDKDLDDLGLTAAQAFDRGLENLRRTQRPLMEVARAVGRGQLGRLTGDPFAPSRLLLPQTWTPLAQAQGGVLIVAAPTTDSVLYIAEDTPTAIDALRAQVAAQRVNAPNRLSDTVLRWRDSGWEVVPQRGAGFKPS